MRSRKQNGDIEATHQGFTGKLGDVWETCPICDRDVPRNQMYRHPVIHKLVCKRCWDDDPKEAGD